jgi:hypothetical protein
LNEHWIVNKIAEMRSYIASDWPGIEERRALYKAVAELEARLQEMKNGPDEGKPEEDKKA